MSFSVLQDGMCAEDSIDAILLRMRKNIHANERANIVNVDRSDVLEGTFRAFQRSSFDHHRVLNVRFSGEQGIDEGGPTRELMRLAIRAIKDTSVFEGPDNEKRLALDSNGKSIFQYYKHARQH